MASSHENWGLLIDVKNWFWAFFAPKCEKQDIMNIWQKSKPWLVASNLWLTYQRETLILNVFRAKKISDSFLVVTCQNLNPFSNLLLKVPLYSRRLANLLLYKGTLSRRLEKGFRFWHVTTKKLSEIFLARKTFKISVSRW